MASGVINFSASSGPLVLGICTIDTTRLCVRLSSPKWPRCTPTRGSGITVPVPVARTRWSAAEVLNIEYSQGLLVRSRERCVYKSCSQRKAPNSAGNSLSGTIVRYYWHRIISDHSLVRSIEGTAPERNRSGVVMSILRLALVAFGTAAFLGLAILGWGGFAAFSHPALVVLAIVVFALSGGALFAGGNVSPGVREDRANRWVIVAFTVIGLLAAYLPAYTDRTEFWTIDSDAIRWVGIGLFAAGPEVPTRQHLGDEVLSTERLHGASCVAHHRSRIRAGAGSAPTDSSLSGHRGTLTPNWQSKMLEPSRDGRLGAVLRTL